MVMVGHISAPGLTGGDKVPASMNEKIITDILRKQLGYNGIVITDAMNMSAISQYYTADEAAVRALKAGADMILMPEDFVAAYEGVIAAVQTVKKIVHSHKMRFYTPRSAFVFGEFVKLYHYVGYDFAYLHDRTRVLGVGNIEHRLRFPPSRGESPPSAFPPAFGPCPPDRHGSLPPYLRVPENA